MSLRVPAAIAVGISLIVLPVIIVRAQAEGETKAPPATEAAEEPAADMATEQAPDASEAAAGTDQEGSVCSERKLSTETDPSATTSDPQVPTRKELRPRLAALQRHSVVRLHLRGRQHLLTRLAGQVFKLPCLPSTGRVV